MSRAGAPRRTLARARAWTIVVSVVAAACAMPAFAASMGDLRAQARAVGITPGSGGLGEAAAIDQFGRLAIEFLDAADAEGGAATHGRSPTGQRSYHAPATPPITSARRHDADCDLDATTRRRRGRAHAARGGPALISQLAALPGALFEAEARRCSSRPPRALASSRAADVIVRWRPRPPRARLVYLEPITATGRSPIAPSPTRRPRVPTKCGRRRRLRPPSAGRNRRAEPPPRPRPCWRYARRAPFTRAFTLPPRKRLATAATAPTRALARRRKRAGCGAAAPTPSSRRPRQSQDLGAPRPRRATAAPGWDVTKQLVAAGSARTRSRASKLLAPTDEDRGQLRPHHWRVWLPH